MQDVPVESLKNRESSDATIHCQVNFFDSDPQPSFIDVPKDFWAFSSVERAESLGLKTGTGNGTFSPNRDLTLTEFLTMTTRAFFSDDPARQPAGGNRYSANVAVAKANGLLAGTDLDSGKANVTDTLDRHGMAQIIWNVQSKLGSVPGSAALEAAKGSIADWSRVPGRIRRRWLLPAPTESALLPICAGGAGSGPGRRKPEKPIPEGR